MSNFKMSSLAMIVFLSLMVSVSSCKNESDKSNDDSVELTAEKDGKEMSVETRGKVSVDGIDKKSEMKINSNGGDDDNDEMNVVMNSTQVDRMPMFSTDCMTKADPNECTEKAVFAFIQDNVEIPSDLNTYKDVNSLEQVIFVVKKDGSVANVKYVASSDQEDCEGCAKSAVDVVSKMNQWKPAMKDGSPVAMQMTIPIRFKNS